MLRRYPVAAATVLIVLSSGCAGSAGSKQTARGYHGDTPAQPRHSGGAADASATFALDRDHQNEDRPGLGTEFGERVHSRVTQVGFERASNSPFAGVSMFYNSAEGIRAQLAYRDAFVRELRAHTPHGGIEVSITDESGRPLQGAYSGDRTYVVGQAGQRYNIKITNNTGGRFEVVTSVDGLDVIDGRRANIGKRGYIIRPYSSITIDGFRTSSQSVAAFRFAAVRDSYAARTGDDRNVGVIGMAFFAERGSRWTTDEIRRRETAQPFDRYASPPPLPRAY